MQFKVSMTRGTTDTTVGILQRYAMEGKSNMRVRLQTEWIVRYLKQKDKMSEALGIYWWFLDPKNFRYTEDIAGVETIKTPEVALHTRQGDCDDIACLIAAMCLTINVPVQFVKVGFTPGHYSHVFVRAFPYGKDQTPVILDPVAGVMTKEMRRTVAEVKLYPVLDEHTPEKMLKP